MISEHLVSEGHIITGIRFSDDEKDQNRADDGIIVFEDVEQRIQFTEAKDGQQESIRHEHSVKYGRAPGVQDMEWKGTKYKREIPYQELLAFELKENLQRLEVLLMNAVEGKIKEKYRGMWLGIVFEGHILSWSESTKQNVKNICDGLVHQYSGRLKAIFQKIFFIECGGRFISRSDLTE